MHRVIFYFINSAFLLSIYPKNGINNTADARIHAPGSPKHTAANAAREAEELTAAPFTISGRNETNKCS